MKSFKIAIIFGIPIEISLSWYIILTLIVTTLACNYFPLTLPGYASWIYWLMALVTALLLFASLLAHELSHALVARANQLPISSITLFIFGGVAHLEKEPASPAVELKMAIAGPIMSLGLASMFWVLGKILLFLSPVILGMLQYLTLINLWIAVFNLLPAFPLDGGRIFRSLVWLITKDIKPATYYASSLGKIFAFMIMGLGFFAIMTGGFLSGIWLILIGLFLAEAADISYQQILLTNKHWITRRIKALYGK